MNRRGHIIKEIGEIHQIITLPNKEEIKEAEKATILTPKVGELLVLMIVPQTMGSKKEEI